MPKKLLYVITSKKNSTKLTKAFLDEGFYITALESTGGFSKKKLVIIMLAVPEKSVYQILRIVKKCCPVQIKASVNSVPIPTIGQEDIVQAQSTQTVKVREGGAAIFIAPLDKIHKI